MIVYCEKLDCSRDVECTSDLQLKSSSSSLRHISPLLTLADKRMRSRGGRRIGAVESKNATINLVTNLIYTLLI